MKITEEVEGKFMSFVNRNGPIIRPDLGHCWIFTNRIPRANYGVFQIDKKAYGAHRVSWTIHCGKIPDGMMICHRCDVKSCVNPVHLYVGDYLDNSMDREKRRRETEYIKRGLKSIYVCENETIFTIPDPSPEEIIRNPTGILVYE